MGRFDRIARVAGFSVLAWIVGACAPVAPGGTAIASVPASSRADPGATVAPTPITPTVQLALTESHALEAPAGAITILMEGHEHPRYVPSHVSAPAGKLVLFIRSAAGSAVAHMGIPHNLQLGLALGEPLATTSTVEAGRGLLVTIEHIPPGVYRFWCTERDGPREPFHFERGMVGTLTITG